jgi:hypothetical protein
MASWLSSEPPGNRAACLDMETWSSTWMRLIVFVSLERADFYVLCRGGALAQLTRDLFGFV